LHIYEKKLRCEWGYYKFTNTNIHLRYTIKIREKNKKEKKEDKEYEKEYFFCFFLLKSKRRVKIYTSNTLILGLTKKECK